MPDSPSKPLESMTPAEYRKAQQDDWNLYVAVQPIVVNGVLCFNTGAPVPASWLASNGIDPTSGLVGKVGSKAVQNAVPDPAAQVTQGPIEPISLNVQV